MSFIMLSVIMLSVVVADIFCQLDYFIATKEIVLEILIWLT